MSAHLLISAKRVAGYVGAPLVALGVALLPALRPATAAAPPALLAKVERVSDGDSLVAVSENGTQLRFRLLGIDAPAVPHGNLPGQPWGEEARDHLTRLIGGRTVRVMTYGRDRDDRILAVVLLGPTNVNVEMVEQGLAVYRGAACQAYCRDLRVAELKARRDRVGVWAPAREYESLAHFRRRVGISGQEGTR
jgi:endonuclease YncB( thermonuclease family)